MVPVAQILLVEPDSGSARSIAEALKGLGFPHHLTRASSSMQAIEFLEDRERFWRRNPDLILLDSALPGEYGFEVLRFVKSVPLYRPIPLVMLASPSRNGEVRRAWDMYVNAIVPMPQTSTDMVATLDAICRLWLVVALRPAPAEG